MLKIFGLSKKDEDSNTKPASNDGGQDGVDGVNGENQLAESTAFTSSIYELLERVKSIEGYLQLSTGKDRYGIIDYSFIDDSEIRAELEKAHCEMWRCRVGVRKHIVEFDEFCFYANKQVEWLLRYYYRPSNNDVSSLLYEFYRTNFTDEYNVINASREIRNVFSHGQYIYLDVPRYVTQNNIQTYSNSFNGQKIEEIDRNLKKKGEQSVSDAEAKERKNKFYEIIGININTYNNLIKAKVLKENESFELINYALTVFCGKIKAKIESRKTCNG